MSSLFLWIGGGVAAALILFGGTQTVRLGHAERALKTRTVERDAANLTIDTQNAAIKAQNKRADDLLADLTREADARNKAIALATRNQEIADGLALKKIEADDRALRAQPIRVRVASCSSTSRPSGGSAPGAVPSTEQAGDGDAGTSTGVLPAANSGRLADAIGEVKKLAIAYAACRAGLVK